jgi:integrase
MAFVKQNASGSWQAIVTFKGKQRKVTRDTRTAVNLAAAQALMEMGGGATDGRNITVDDMVVAWLADSTHHSATYRSDVLSVIGRLPLVFGAREVATVNAPMITALYVELAKPDGEAMTPHRLRRMHEILGTAWEFAISQGWAVFNPVRASRKPALPERDIAVPDADVVHQLLAATVGTQLGLYLAVAAEIGSRRGETVALQWADVRGSTIRVERGLAYTVATGVVQTEGKTKRKGHRTVTISPALVALLAAERAAQAERSLAAGLGNPVWVFSHDAGLSPWRPDYATKQFMKLRDRLGIDGVRLHDLRHFNVSEQLAAGVPVTTVARRVGHSVTSTTMGVYAHYNQAADEAAAAVMGALLAR